MIHDKACRSWTNHNPNLLVPWYLMASWAYYIEDDPILSDGAFDMVCTKLAALWDSIDHPHKKYVTRGDLDAGSCLLSRSVYPRRVIGGLEHIRRFGPSKTTV